MIYTVTFNPAVDYVMHPLSLDMGFTNRSQYEEFTFGGKGIDVSAVLTNLHVPNIAMGFVAGFSGHFIEEALHEYGIMTDLIWLDTGNTRINVKIQNLAETRINGAGPYIPQDKYRKLIKKLDKLVSGDTLVLNGSLPSCLPEDTYASIMERYANKGIRYVVDATGDLLLRSIKSKPFLIKPNNHELGDLFDLDLETPEECLPYAHKLHEMGAINVLVSCGGNGACLVDEDGNEYVQEAPEGTVVNTTGAGDSMVAGFLATVDQGRSYQYALRFASACGSATAFSSGMATREEVEKLLRQM